MSLARHRLSAEPPDPTERLRSIGRLLLVVLAAALPFEVPLITVGPLTITTVELVIYLLLAVWLAGRVHLAYRRRRWLPAAVTDGDRPTGRVWAGRDRLAAATALWLAVVVVSAVAAPDHRVAAAKFALRSVGGGLIFFAARDLVRSHADLRRVATALLVGALLSAAGAIAEAAMPSTELLWRAFHGDTFSVTGVPRPSGPFGYPTIAAMFWEAALPLAIAIPVTRQADFHRHRWMSVAAGIGAGTLLVGAIFFSATRTGLAVSLLACVAMLTSNWSMGRRLPAVAGGVLALVVLLAAVALLSPAAAASPLSMRLRWWQDGNWYRAHYEPSAGKLTLVAGSLTDVEVKVQNTGGLVWPHASADAVHLSYHWEKDDNVGTHLTFEGRRSLLPFDMAPGMSATIIATIDVPDEPGHYRLRWDLVREHVTWFSEAGSDTEDQEVDVVARTAAHRKDRYRQRRIVDTTLEDWVSTGIPSRPELWGAAVRLWRRHPLMGVGPDNFRRDYPQVLPPLPAGSLVGYDDRVHANSLYFETLADMGVSGVVALALLMTVIGRAAWRQIRGAATPPLARAVPIAVGSFFVHGLLDSFLAFTPTYALLWLLAGLMASVGGRARSTPDAAIPTPT